MSIQLPIEQKPSSSTVATSRTLYPVKEAREQLGGISHTGFYGLVAKGQIHLVKLGRRSFVTADEIRRIASGRRP